MKRFVIAALAALAIGFGTAATADAQYIIQYNGPTPNGGAVSRGSIYDLGGYGSYNTYVSPFGTVRQQSYITNGWSSFGLAQGYNPYTGLGYSRSFYSPAPGLVVTPSTFNPGYRIPTIAPLPTLSPLPTITPIGGFGYPRRW